MQKESKSCCSLILLSIEQEELLTLWIADKVNAIIDNENEVADKALRLITMSRYGNEY